MIICFAVGENFPIIHKGWEKAIKNLDIAEVMPRKDNAIEDRHPGRQGIKDFLCLKVDASSINDAKYKLLREELTSPWVENGKITERRRWCLDISKVPFETLSDTVRDSLKDMANASRNHQSYDCEPINIFLLGKIISFNKIKPYLLNRQTGQYLNKVIA